VADQPLTRAQRRAAVIILETVGGDGFCLAGGAALAATGISIRPTRDIDAFTDQDVDMIQIGNRVAEALRQAGFMVTPDRVFPGSVSLQVAAGRRSRFQVDLGRDHREWPPVESPLGPTLSPRELAANKMLALFGRVQPRDLADVATLAGQCDLNEVLTDAAVKDPGFNRTILAEMIRLVVARPDPEWPLGVDAQKLRAFGRDFASSLERG
jgi:hypothetical protein